MAEPVTSTEPGGHRRAEERAQPGATEAGPGDRRGLPALFWRVREQVAKVVVGQEHVLEGLMAAVAVGGHVLLEGPPGVAKTLLARAFAASCALDMRRIQFTPDLLPSDVTGTSTLRAGELVFRKGPVFANVVLADEINRTPPKTQAALLEAMQEGRVNMEGESHDLPSPFLLWRPRTRSSTRERTPSPRHSWIGS